MNRMKIETKGNKKIVRQTLDQQKIIQFKTLGAFDMTSKEKSIKGMQLNIANHSYCRSMLKDVNIATENALREKIFESQLTELNLVSDLISSQIINIGEDLGHYKQVIEILENKCNRIPRRIYLLLACEKVIGFAKCLVLANSRYIISYLGLGELVASIFISISYLLALGFTTNISLYRESYQRRSQNQSRMMFIEIIKQKIARMDNSILKAKKLKTQLKDTLMSNVEMLGDYLSIKISLIEKCITILLLWVCLMIILPGSAIISLCFTSLLTVISYFLHVKINFMGGEVQKINNQIIDLAESIQLASVSNITNSLEVHYVTKYSDYLKKRSLIINQIARRFMWIDLLNLTHKLLILMGSMYFSSKLNGATFDDTIYQIMQISLIIVFFDPDTCFTSHYLRIQKIKKEFESTKQLILKIPEIGFPKMLVESRDTRCGIRKRSYIIHLDPCQFCLELTGANIGLYTDEYLHLILNRIFINHSKSLTDSAVEIKNLDLKIDEKYILSPKSFLQSNISPKLETLIPHPNVEIAKSNPRPSLLINPDIVAFVHMKNQQSSRSPSPRVDEKPFSMHHLAYPKLYSPNRKKEVFAKKSARSSATVEKLSLTGAYSNIKKKKNSEVSAHIFHSLRKSIMIQKEKMNDNLKLIQNIGDIFDDGTGKKIFEIVLHGIAITIEKAEKLCIIGTDHKSISLLISAILGEVKLKGNNVKFNRNGSIGHLNIKESPFSQDISIKENILFGETFDQSKYESLINLVGLHRLLEENLDEKPISSFGLRISTFEKRCILIARLLYRDHELYIFEDVFTQIESPKDYAIFTKIVKGYLLEKSLIIVSNSLECLKESHSVILMDGGTLKWKGHFKELTDNRKLMSSLLLNEENTEFNLVSKRIKLFMDMLSNSTFIRNMSISQFPKIKSKSCFAEVESESINRGRDDERDQDDKFRFISKDNLPSGRFILNQTSKETGGLNVLLRHSKQTLNNIEFIKMTPTKAGIISSANMTASLKIMLIGIVLIDFIIWSSIGRIKLPAYLDKLTIISINISVAAIVSHLFWICYSKTLYSCSKKTLIENSLNILKLIAKSDKKNLEEFKMIQKAISRLNSSISNLVFILRSFIFVICWILAPVNNNIAFGVGSIFILVVVLMIINSIQLECFYFAGHSLIKVFEELKFSFGEYLDNLIVYRRAKAIHFLKQSFLIHRLDISFFQIILEKKLIWCTFREDMSILFFTLFMFCYSICSEKLFYSDHIDKASQISTHFLIIGVVSICLKRFLSRYKWFIIDDIPTFLSLERVIEARPCKRINKSTSITVPSNSDAKTNELDNKKEDTNMTSCYLTMKSVIITSITPNLYSNIPFDLEVRRGETVSIFGNSISGKESFCRMIWNGTSNLSTSQQFNLQIDNEEYTSKKRNANIRTLETEKEILIVSDTIEKNIIADNAGARPTLINILRDLRIAEVIYITWLNDLRSHKTRIYMTKQEKSNYKELFKLSELYLKLGHTEMILNRCRVFTSTGIYDSVIPSKTLHFKFYSAIMELYLKKVVAKESRVETQINCSIGEDLGKSSAYFGSIYSRIKRDANSKGSIGVFSHSANDSHENQAPNWMEYEKSGYKFNECQKLLRNVESRIIDRFLQIHLDHKEGYISEFIKRIIALSRLCLSKTLVLVTDESQLETYGCNVTENMIILRKYLGEGLVIFFTPTRLYSAFSSSKVLVFDNGEKLDDGHPFALIKNSSTAFHRLLSSEPSTFEHGVRMITYLELDVSSRGKSRNKSKKSLSQFYYSEALIEFESEEEEDIKPKKKCLNEWRVPMTLKLKQKSVSNSCPSLDSEPSLDYPSEDYRCSKNDN